MTKVLAVVAPVLAAVDAAILWAFVARFALRPWRENREGRHLMAFRATFALTLTLTAAFHYAAFTHPVDFPAALALSVQAVLFVAIGIVAVGGHRLLELPRRDIDDDDNDDESSRV